jgi:hypothetical protein
MIVQGLFLNKTKILEQLMSKIRLFDLCDFFNVFLKKIIGVSINLLIIHLYDFSLSFQYKFFKVSLIFSDP